MYATFFIFLFYFLHAEEEIFSVCLCMCVCVNADKTCLSGKMIRGICFGVQDMVKFHVQKLKTASCIRDLQSIHRIPPNAYIYNREREWSDEDDAC